MKKILIRLTFIGLAVIFATTAYGQKSDWYVAAMVVYANDDGDRNIDDSFAGGQLSVGRAVTEHVSIEGSLGYSDIDGFPGQKHLDISVNGLAFIDRDATFSPYFLAGIGYLGTKIDGAGEENRPSGTLGLGFIWALGDSAVSIRAEYRARLAWEQDNNLTDFISSVGLQFSFGTGTGTTKTNIGFDSDGDGVSDHWDLCSGTARGVAVDYNGCEPDGDRDGIADRSDACPDTATAAWVDEFGCPLDSDGAGVE